MPKITIYQKPTCTTCRQVYNALKESGVDFEAVDYQLCRYITRPAIANERLKRNRAGQVVLQLKSPYKDGTTHILWSRRAWALRGEANRPNQNPPDTRIEHSRSTCNHKKSQMNFSALPLLCLKKKPLENESVQI